MSEGAEEVVRRFCAAWNANDLESLVELMTENAVYHVIPIGPVQGEQAIRQAFKAFLDLASNINLEIRNIGTAGSVVFAERVDHFDVGEAHVDLPCAGVYEVVNDKIAAWRDYCDVGMFDQQHSLSEEDARNLREAHGE
jgi:limonene-1,2-epoxide hydrolase